MKFLSVATAHLGPAVAGLLVVGISAFWVFRIVLGAGWVGHIDLTTYYYPLYASVFAQLSEGVPPLWDPYQFGGTPLLASLQGGFFYPFHIIYFLLPTNLGLAFSGWLHLMITGLGMAAFARRLGLSGAAALLAAILLVLRGKFPAMLFHPNFLEAAAWLPLGGVAVLGLVNGRKLHSMVGLSICSGLSWLAGYPQATVYVIYTWASILFAQLLLQRSGNRIWLTAIAGFTAAMLLGVGLGAAQLLPALELTSEGTRALEPTAVASIPSATDGIGYALAEDLADLLHNRSVIPNGLPMSFGLVALCLLPIAFIWRGRRGLALGTSMLGLLALLFALGPLTPFFEFYKAIPPLDVFRYSGRILFIADFCFALVAAFGLETIMRSTWLSTLRVPGGLPGWAQRGGMGTLIAGLITLLVALELFLAKPNDTWLPYFDLDRHAILHSGNEKAIAHLAGQSDRSWIPTLPMRSGPVYGIRSFDGFEPLNLRRHAKYFYYLSNGSSGGTHFAGQPFSGFGPFLNAETINQRGRLLDLAATRFFLLPPESQGEYSRKLEPLLQDGNLVVYENPDALPRAFVVYDVAPAPGDLELLEIISQPDFDPLEQSYLDDLETASLESTHSRRGQRATITRDEAHVVEIEAQLDAPGFVVLADSFYPGWRASVDGQDAPIHAANFLFRAVPVEAGSHLVRFEYRPASLTWGLAVSAASALAVLMIFRYRGAEAQ